MCVKKKKINFKQVSLLSRLPTNQCWFIVNRLKFMSQYHSPLRLPDSLYFKNVQHNRKEIVERKKFPFLTIEKF